MKPDLSIVPEREIPKPPKRRELTRAEFAQLILDQKGRCGCGCGGKLFPMTEGVIDEHVIAIGYGKEDANDLKNRAIYRKPCAKRKTAEEDQPGIAKAKRLAGETCNTAGKPIPIHVDPWGKNRPGAPKAKWAKRPLPTKKTGLEKRSGENV